MGRPELPVDHSVPQRAELAEWLRRRRAARGLTYEQMAADERTDLSAATLKRAASGRSVPKLSVVQVYVRATRATPDPADDMELAMAMRRAEHLWGRAKYATQRARYTTPGHYRIPDPRLVDDRADLSRALRDLHAASGAPSPNAMESAAPGYGTLPAATARRILEGRTLPVRLDQHTGFLIACGLDPLSDQFTWWIVAFERAMAREMPRMQERARYEQMQISLWQAMRAA